MDEPTLGLDINVKRTIRQFLKKINEDNGISILLTSHDLDDIDEICKDAIVLSGGEQIYNGTINDLKIRYRKPDMDDIVSTIFAEGKVV